MRTGPLVLALAGLLAGCDSGEETNLDDFIGVWTATGTVNTRCGMGAGTNTPLMETVTITKGVEAPLLVVVGACSLQMDAEDKVATLRPGQKCMMMRNTATYNSGDYTVSGIKATFNLNASLTLGDTGLVLACEYQATGTATKLPK